MIKMKDTYSFKFSSTYLFKVKINKFILTFYITQYFKNIILWAISIQIINELLCVFINLLLYIFIPSMGMYDVCARSFCDMFVEVRGQHSGIGSLIPSQIPGIKLWSLACSESVLSLSHLSMFFLYRNFIKSVLCFLHLSNIFVIGPITLLDLHRSRGYSVWSAISRSIYRSAYILAQQSFFPHGYPNSS